MKFSLSTRDYIFLSILLIASYFVLFHNLGALSLKMWDESRNAVNALEMLLNGNYIVAHYDGRPEMWSTKPPLFIWAEVISMKIFGINEFAVRFPSALCTFTIIIFTYFFSRNYFSDALGGLLSGLVLLTSFGFIHYHVARNADYDAMLTMWVFFYCILFYKYFETDRTRYLLLGSLCLSAAILTKSIAAVLIAPGVFIAFLSIREYRLKMFTLKNIAYIAGGILLALSFYPIREHYNPGYIDEVIFQEITGRFGAVSDGHVGGPLYYFYRLVRIHFVEWFYYLPAAFTLLLVVKNNKTQRFALISLCGLLVYFLALSSSETKIEWYDAQAYPFFAIIIGLFLSSILKRVITQFSKKTTGITIGLLTLIGIFALPINKIANSSIKETYENEHTNLFYGDYLDRFYAMYPDNAALKVYNAEYNAALLFYLTRLKHEGKKVTEVGSTQLLTTGDTVLVCTQWQRDKIAASTQFEILHEDGERYTLKITATEGGYAGPIRDKADFLARVSRIEAKAKSNENWVQEIQAKAKNNRITEEQQLKRDVLWILQQETQVPDSLANLLLMP